MGTSLKDALMKAGIKPKGHENKRQWRPQKEQTKVEKFQQERNFCEVCETIQPDVEQYIHRNPTVKGQWICVRCADLNYISDKTRKTSQSTFSRQGKFRREFI